MATVADILQYMETIAPSAMKEDWDNVGLNCGRMDKEVKKLLVALDPFDDVCREQRTGARSAGHPHALIWEPVHYRPGPLGSNGSCSSSKTASPTQRPYKSGLRAGRVNDVLQRNWGFPCGTLTPKVWTKSVASWGCSGRYVETNAWTIPRHGQK